jgi:hypothetical protein
VVGDHSFLASPEGRDFMKLYSQDLTCFHGAVPIKGVIYKNMFIYMLLIIVIIVIGKGEVAPVLN